MSGYKFNDNTDEVLQALDKAIRRGLESIGQAAEGHAKEITPVDTGRLLNSITHVTDDKAAYIGTNVEYAIFVEEGARGRTGKHMLRKAATDHTQEYQQIMKDSIRNS